MLKTIALLLGFLLIVFKPVTAQEVKNNKFGIGLAQPHLEDLQKAKEMINSNGGDWGYVTLVIQENDRDKGKWQEIFDKLREYHLIPIVRLATLPEGAKWKKPNPKDANSWAEFLNSLNWVVKDRYVILFNEPNHGAEWGGKTDPADYANIAFEFAQKLKEKNADFFIMLAGLDASTPHSPPNYEDEAVFLKQVFSNQTIDQWNNVLSGLASHSYPNPAFAGSPSGVGRGSVRTYQWELQLLASFGVKDLPVFITETGWDRGLLGEDLTASNLKTSFDTVWLPDERVIAVTPFVLDYQGDPFLNFSWKKFQSNEFYQQFYTVKSLNKQQGEPLQIEQGTITFDLPRELVAHSSFHFQVKLKNLGQAMWDKDYGYQLSIINDREKSLEYFFSDLKRIKPFEEADIDLFMKTDENIGKRKLGIELLKNKSPLLTSADWNFETFPLPKLAFEVGLFPHFRSSGNDFEIQIFNKKEEIVFKKKNVKVKNGRGVIEEVQNITLGEKYRAVMLKPFYLPKQAFIVFKKDKNNILFELMIPLDFNQDGTLDFDDWGKLLKNPALLRNFLPF